MSVGKNSIQRAAGKTAPQDKEIKGAAPELANTCVAAAPKAKPAAKKAPAKAAPKAAPAKAAPAKKAAAPKAANAALQTAPTGKCEKYAFGEELPFYLL